MVPLLAFFGIALVIDGFTNLAAVAGFRRDLHFEEEFWSSRAPHGQAYSTASALTPGNSLPSSHSRKAPPAVET